MLQHGNSGLVDLRYLLVPKAAFGTFLYLGLIALGPQLYLGLAFGTILYPIMKMFPGFAAFGSFVLGGSCPGYIFVLWAGHPGYVFVLGAGRPGYVFVLGAGRPELAFQVMLINPWLAWGWQPLVQKSRLGGALSTNRCSGQATPGTRGVQIPIPITKSLLLRFTSPHSQKINYRDSGFAFA